MPTLYSSTNPLQITVNDNTTVRAVFKRVNIDTETPPPVDTRWRDCVSGQLRTGTPPSGYTQVTYSGAGGGTCWEPRAVIGFEPNLEDVLRFDWRRGTAYPDARTVRVTNPSTARFNAVITSSADIIVTPSSFTIAPRSSQTFTVRPTTSLLDRLADGISTINFKVEFTEVI